MSKKKASRNGKLVPGTNVRLAPDGASPAEVSGLFKDDPTFAEFREILRQQREQDYRETLDEIESESAKEAQACSSLIPTPSRTIKKRIRSSKTK